LVALLYTIIGYLYLWIRYQNHEKVAQVKREKYEDRYAVAGALIIFSTIGVIFLIALSIILLGTIYIIFTKPPSKPY